MAFWFDGIAYLEVGPLPVDPSDPAKDIYGDHSYPGVDGVNLWPLLLDPSNTNRSSAHPTLVLSKEVIIVGRYKLLVGQNAGWDHSSDNGWKQASPPPSPPLPRPAARAASTPLTTNPDIKEQHGQYVGQH